MIEDILITDLNAVSPYFRLLNNIRSRIKAIEWQTKVQNKHPEVSRMTVKKLKRMEKSLLVIKYTNTKSIDYQEIKKRFKSTGSTEEHIIKIFGNCLKPGSSRVVDPVEANMLASMAKSNKQKRVIELQTRILLEILDKESKGWFIVFNTLTIANEYMEKVYKRENRIFEKYILSLNYAVKMQTEKIGEGKTKETADYHTYFAVVEEGTKTGRLHFHVLHFFRNLPNNCNDPNNGRRVPSQRIISELRNYWLYGYSTPIAVRLSAMDNYNRVGWIWPVCKELRGSSYVALEASSPLRMARYMSKYITKANEERAFRWRTRLSKGFGTKIIKIALTRIATSTLESQMIAVAMWRHLEVMGISFPMALTRKLALKEYLLRKSSEQKSSRTSTIQRSLMMVKRHPSIVEQYRALIRKKPRSSLQNIGSLQTQSLKRADIFEIHTAFTEALEECGHHIYVQEGRGSTWLETTVQ